MRDVWSIAVGLAEKNGEAVAHPGPVGPSQATLDDFCEDFVMQEWNENVFSDVAAGCDDGAADADDMVAIGAADASDDPI
jgi:hypothetical protein